MLLQPGREGGRYKVRDDTMATMGAESGGEAGTRPPQSKNQGDVPQKL